MAVITELSVHGVLGVRTHWKHFQGFKILTVKCMVKLPEGEYDDGEYVEVTLFTDERFDIVEEPDLEVWNGNSTRDCQAPRWLR